MRPFIPHPNVEIDTIIISHKMTRRQHAHFRYGYLRDDDYRRMQSMGLRNLLNEIPQRRTRVCIVHCASVFDSWPMLDCEREHEYLRVPILFKLMES